MGPSSGDSSVLRRRGPPQVSGLGVTLVCENLPELQIFRLYAMAQLAPNAFAELHRCHGSRSHGRPPKCRADAESSSHG